MLTGVFRQSHLILIVLGLSCFLLLTLILFSIYQQPIYIWDEAIYANNALEMAQHHNYLVYTNNGVPDHYNSKPPMALWLQSISFQLFSFSEFALRLPTFLALIGIIALFYLTSKKLNLSPGVFIVATFILLTTRGAIRPHVFLSGDLDGLLVFFVTGMVCIQLTQLNEKKISTHSILLLSLCLLGAYFTKSTAAFLIVPSLMIGYWHGGLFTLLLRNKLTYLCLAVFCLLVIAYYALRESYDPGYLRIVWDSEFKRYVSRVMSWQEQPFLYYFKNIATRFNIYYSVITACIALPYLLLKNVEYKRLVFYIFLSCFIFLLCISIPATKLEWYDAPLYPLWAFGLAIMLCELYQWSTKRFETTPIYPMLFPILLSLIALFLVDRICVEELTANRVYQSQEQAAALLKSIDKKYQKSSYTVFMDVEENKVHHFDALNFYVKSMSIDKRVTVALKRIMADVKPFDTLIVMQPVKIDSLRKCYAIHEIEDGYLAIGIKREPIQK